MHKKFMCSVNVRIVLLFCSQANCLSHRLFPDLINSNKSNERSIQTFFIFQRTFLFTRPTLLNMSHQKSVLDLSRQPKRGTLNFQSIGWRSLVCSCLLCFWYSSRYFSWHIVKCHVLLAARYTSLSFFKTPGLAQKTTRRRRLAT